VDITTDANEISQGEALELKAPAKLRTISFYRSSLMKSLSPEIMKTNPWRMVGFFSYAAVALASVFLIVTAPMAWPFKVLLGVVIGFCNGNLGFLSHEFAHGSVVKNKNLQDVFVFFGMAPFFISPTFWRFWHNKLHHLKTQQLIHDPDAFPNFRIYKISRFMQNMFPYTPGSGTKRSYSYFFFWFSFHNFVAQAYLRFRNNVFDSLDHRRVTLEFGAAVLLVGAFAWAVGPANWLYVLVIPFFVQNYGAMSYIATNHNLSPLTDENDPLANSVTVTNHPILEWLTLNFGYHVEHHLFPTVNGANIKAVHRELKKQFPDEYIAVPKWQAIKALYRTPRIYKNSKTLIHPITKQEAKIAEIFSPH
jgi:fatty acid desaturase